MKRIWYVLLGIQLPAFAVFSATPPTNCQTALKTIFTNEGGYQCIRGDVGNWTSGKIRVGTLRGTKYGISAASYPKVDIKNLTLAQAARFYERDYWNPLHLGDIKSQWLATMFLDTAVNCGVGTAAILVARAENVLRGKTEQAPVDPTLSKQDIDWINSYTQTRWWNTTEKDTARRALFGIVFREMRARRYLDIVERKPGTLKWLPIWLRRT